MEDAPVTIWSRCGEGETESSVPGLQVVVEGESGRNELLRGPFALFGVLTCLSNANIAFLPSLCYTPIQ